MTINKHVKGAPVAIKTYVKRQSQRLNQCMTRDRLKHVSGNEAGDDTKDEIEGQCQERLLQSNETD